MYTIHNLYNFSQLLHNFTQHYTTVNMFDNTMQYLHSFTTQNYAILHKNDKAFVYHVANAYRACTKPYTSLQTFSKYSTQYYNTYTYFTNKNN